MSNLNWAINKLQILNRDLDNARYSLDTARELENIIADLELHRKEIIQCCY